MGCNRAVQVQRRNDTNLLDTSGDISFNSWLDLNLAMPLIAVLFLPPRFGINIWKATNDLQFNNSRLTTDQIAIKSISLTSEIQKAFYSDSGTDMNMYPP